mgnify:CR=1 FL=1
MLTITAISRWQLSTHSWVVCVSWMTLCHAGYDKDLANTAYPAFTTYGGLTNIYASATWDQNGAVSGHSREASQGQQNQLAQREQEQSKGPLIFQSLSCVEVARYSFDLHVPVEKAHSLLGVAALCLSTQAVALP